MTERPRDAKLRQVVAIQLGNDDILSSEQFLKARAQELLGQYAPSLVGDGKGDIKGDEMWVEKPVDVQQFVEDSAYLNLKGQSHAKILELLAILDTPEIHQALLELGKRSGKGYTCSIIHARMAYIHWCMRNPHKVYGIAPGDPVVLLNCATNAPQANKIVFNYFKARFENSGKFVKVSHPRYIRDVPSDKIWYLEGRSEIMLPKQLAAISGHSEDTAWLGYNLLCAILDELNFFHHDVRHDAADDLWDAALSICEETFPDWYKLIGISSVNHVGDFGDRKRKELDAELTGRKDSFYISLPSWEVRDDRTFADYTERMKRNRRRIMRDFGCVRELTIEPYYTDYDVIENLFTDKAAPLNEQRFRGWFWGKPIKELNAAEILRVPSPSEVGFDPSFTGLKLVGEEVDPDTGEPLKRYEKTRCVSVWDLAKNRDAAGGAFAHAENRDGQKIVVFDLVVRIAVPNEREQINQLKIFQFIQTVESCGFNVAKVGFDNFQSLGIRQLLETKGFTVEYVSADRNTTAHDTLQQLVGAKQAECYRYMTRTSGPDAEPTDIITFELQGLELNSARDKVDHSRVTSKDVVDAMCLCAFLLMSEEVTEHFATVAYAGIQEQAQKAEPVERQAELTEEQILAGDY